VTVLEPCLTLELLWKPATVWDRVSDWHWRLEVREVLWEVDHWCSNACSKDK